jgi:hypothetical protein
LSKTIATLRSEGATERKKTDDELQKLTAKCQKLEGELREEREKSAKKIGSFSCFLFFLLPSRF